MKVIRGLRNLKKCHQKLALTIGKFDGVHLGHQHLLNQLVQYAKEKNNKSAVMILDPSPNDFFQKNTERILPLRERMIVFANSGIDFLIVLPFNRQLQQMSARSFIKTILIDSLGIDRLWVGSDFRFGTDRAGDFSLLESYASQYNFTLSQTKMIGWENRQVSSSQIRALVANNQFATAQKLLNRPFLISGRVIHGQKLGRKIGVPTANLSIAKRSQQAVLKLLKMGVYLVKVWCANQEHHVAVSNLGMKPTVKNDRLTLEIHFLNWSGNLYGERLVVEFISFIRSEKKFASLTDLKQQIDKDITVARQQWQENQQQLWNDNSHDPLTKPTQQFFFSKLT